MHVRIKKEDISYDGLATDHLEPFCEYHFVSNGLPLKAYAVAPPREPKTEEWDDEPQKDGYDELRKMDPKSVAEIRWLTIFGLAVLALSIGVALAEHFYSIESAIASLGTTILAFQIAEKIGAEK